MRVLLIAPSTLIVGGQSRQAAKLLDLLGHESELEVGFVPHNPVLPTPFRWLQKIKYVRTVATTSAYWLSLVWKLPQYDVAQIFSASYYSYLLSVAPAILLAKLFRTKSIVNYRSGEAEDHLTRWPRSTVPIMRLADAIVTPSQYLVDVFARFGLRAQSIFNNVEFQKFRYRERDVLAPRFLASRSLEPLYNVECTLKAFSIIQSKYPDATLTIVGDGPLRHDLEELAKKLELRNVRFLGFVSFEEMAALYDEADIYLNSPDIDNAPNSLIECMVSGLPIVTTDAGGIPYLVTHEKTCLMAPRGDEVGLAAAALRFLDEPGLASRISTTARRQAESFRWQAIREKWLSLYVSLAQPGS